MTWDDEVLMTPSCRAPLGNSITTGEGMLGPATSSALSCLLSHISGCSSVRRFPFCGQGSQNQEFAWPTLLGFTLPYLTLTEH